jgi:hypothetical protein
MDRLRSKHEKRSAKTETRFSLLLQPFALRPPLFPVLSLLFLLLTSCVRHPQRYEDFSTPTPLQPGTFLILGFVGGREAWDNPSQGVRQFALNLKAKDLYARIETVENQKRNLALRLVSEAFDQDRDGNLDKHETQSIRLILYGQSFGGAAVVKLARQLKTHGVPVRLTIQIDSVGRGDGLIPSNVVRAANLYQSDGVLIKGQSLIRAEDPSRTKILGNYRFGYKNLKIDLSGIRWHKKVFRKAHTKMGLDPEVWCLVETLILSEINRGPQPNPGHPQQVKVPDLSSVPSTAWLRRLD